MRQPALASAVMESVVKAVRTPVTVKMRKGWDDQHVNAVEIAQRAEAAGIAAVAVHGRTREQFYAGAADWDIIRCVKQSVSIPVIGNGDVRSPQDAAALLEQTGCDGIMIGRGAQGNPWIFRQVKHYLATGELMPLPDVTERITVLLRQLDMLVALKGEYTAIREMRSHAAWYTKGLRHSAELRLQFNKAENREDFVRIMSAFLVNTQE